MHRTVEGKLKALREGELDQPPLGVLLLGEARHRAAVKQIVGFGVGPRRPSSL
jgi:hypothetical protein